MKKRVLFFSLQFFIYFSLISLSILLYFTINTPGSGPNIIKAYKFFISRKENFILIYLFLFLISYLTGIFEVTTIYKQSFLKNFLLINIKFLFTVSIVSFIELFFFFTNKVGRFVYVYMILIFSLYSCVYILVYKKKRTKLFIILDKLIPEILNNNFKDELDKIEYISLAEFSRAKNHLQLGSFSFLYLNNFPEKNIEFDFLKRKIEGIEFIKLVDFLENELERIPLEHITTDWIMQKFTDIRVSYLKLTRIINITVSIVALIILFPLGIIFSALNKIFSKGPIFYVQERVGEGGGVFRLFKFRTMKTEAEKNGPVYTSGTDKRITFVGKIMRKLRIDEIPQFLNVIRGDINLIGPRPERAVFVEELTKNLPYYNLRHIVKPGLTGWAQVNYSYAGADLKEQKMKFEYDLFYIKNRSLLLDLLVMIKTVRSVFNLRGK